MSEPIILSTVNLGAYPPVMHIREVREQDCEAYDVLVIDAGPNRWQFCSRVGTFGELGLDRRPQRTGGDS